MIKTKLYCDINYKVGDIDTRLYGSFLEHMGRVIYTGIYEPEHELADEEGFRTDVMEKVHEMGVTCVRYPGGNFVSNYHWEDGIGPKDRRPCRLDLAWKAIETNQFGTDEFMHWSKKADVQPIFTVNLGTRGIEEAINYIEYCNFPRGTVYSDLRKSHGVEQPYNVKLWCLGNEMDGEWQLGHKSAFEYGRLAAETGKAMKIIDPSIELIACGSSLSNMPSYPDWDIEVLEQTYDIVDYLALHQYYGGQEKGTQEFLAQTIDMEEYIKTIRAAAQIVKRKKHSEKDMKFSLDEWGVWSVPGNTVNKEIDERPWQSAAAISEQIYTLEDALLFAGMQIVMLKNADVIKIACQSLLTNVSACIMTEKNGEVWVQPIFYPFYYFANYARGIVLKSEKMGDCYQTEKLGAAPYVDEVFVLNDEKKELCLFLVNKGEAEETVLDVELCGLKLKSMIEHVVLLADNKKRTNFENHNAVIPCKGAAVEVHEGKCSLKLEPLSFHMIRFSI